MSVRAGAIAIAIAAAPAAAQLNGERVDLAVPTTVKAGQGAIVVAFRRPDAQSLGKSASVGFARYDRDRRDLDPQPKGAKKAGIRTTFGTSIRHKDKKAPLEHAVMMVSPGDYVLASATVGPDALQGASFCLGAPVFTVREGEVVYFGDLTPYLFARMADGERRNAMGYSAHFDAAKTALAGQPDLAARLRPAAIENEATFACAGATFSAYRVPGAPVLAAGPESPVTPAVFDTPAMAPVPVGR